MSKVEHFFSLVPGYELQLLTLSSLQSASGLQEVSPVQ